MSDMATKLAVMENELSHLNSKHDKLEARLDDLIDAVEKNNELISKSRGVVLGASLVISSIWAVGITLWNYFVK